MSAPLRIVVVGAGLMGAAHGRAVKTCPLAQLCAVVDRDQDVVASLADELSIPGVQDLEQAVAETSPDAAIIATPDPTHRQIAEVAIDAGLHLLVEKPLATSVGDAQAIVDRAEDRGVRVLAGHIVRFDHRYTQIADAARSGQMGVALFLGASRWTTTKFGVRVANTTTPLWHLLVHDIDIIQWVSGASISEVAMAINVESASGQSAFSATGSLSNGAMFQVAGGWTLPEGITRHRASFELHGSESHATIDVWEEGLVISGPTKAHVGEGPAQPVVHGTTAGWLAQEIGHFVTGVLSDQPFVISTAEAVDAVRGVEALQAATVHREVLDSGHRSVAL